MAELPKLQKGIAMAKTTARSTKSESEMRERLEQVALCLAKGWKKSEINRVLCEKWDISSRTMETYLSRARGILAEWWNFYQGSDSRIELLAQVATVHQDIMTSVESSDKDRIAAAIALSKLFGLDAPVKIAPTTPDGMEQFRIAISDMSEEQLAITRTITKRIKEAAAASRLN